jgi:hypothetical protein
MEKFGRQGNSLTSFVCGGLGAGLIGHGVNVGAHFLYLLVPEVGVSLPPMWCSSFARLPLQCTLCRSRRFLHGLPSYYNSCLPANRAHYNLLCKGFKSFTLNYRKRARPCNSNPTTTDTNLRKSATRVPKTQNRESIRVSIPQTKKVLLEEMNAPSSIFPRFTVDLPRAGPNWSNS